MSVYMRAHPKAEEVSADDDADADDLDKLANGLCKALKSQGLPADPKQLRVRLDEELSDLEKIQNAEAEGQQAAVAATAALVSTGKIDPEDVVEAVGTYLTEDEGIGEDVVDEMEDSGATLAAVQSVIKKLALGPKEETKIVDSGPTEHYTLSKIKPVRIKDEDVLAFKSGMQLTRGSWGVKDVREYEESDPKL
jgi:hypothetical protein